MLINEETQVQKYEPITKIDSNTVNSQKNPEERVKKATYSTLYREVLVGLLARFKVLVEYSINLSLHKKKKAEMARV